VSVLKNFLTNTDKLMSANGHFFSSCSAIHLIWTKTLHVTMLVQWVYIYWNLRSYIRVSIAFPVFIVSAVL